MVTDDHIRTVSEEPLTLVLILPDGCTPGRWEAAVAFTNIVAEMRKRHPNREFQLVPFNYDTPKDGTDPALKAMLAIAK